MLENIKPVPVTQHTCKCGTVIPHARRLCAPCFHALEGNGSECYHTTTCELCYPILKSFRSLLPPTEYKLNKTQRRLKLLTIDCNVVSGLAELVYKLGKKVPILLIGDLIDPIIEYELRQGMILPDPDSVMAPVPQYVVNKKREDRFVERFPLPDIFIDDRAVQTISPEQRRMAEKIVYKPEYEKRAVLKHINSRARYHHLEQGEGIIKLFPEPLVIDYSTWLSEYDLLPDE